MIEGVSEMSEKSIKILFDNEEVEYKIEDDTCLVLEIQNQSNQLSIKTKEKLNRLSNNFEKIQFKQPRDNMSDFDYQPKVHESSIYEVLKSKITHNTVSEKSETDLRDNQTTIHTEAEKSSQNKSSENKADSALESNDPNNYQRMVSELYKELTGNDSEDEN